MGEGKSQLEKVGSFGGAEGLSTGVGCRPNTPQWGWCGRAGLCPSPVYSPPSRGKSFSFSRAYSLPSPAPLFQPHTQRLTPGPDQSKHRSMRDSFGEGGKEKAAEEERGDSV